MASRDGEDPAWGRTGDLVRTYKAINDPNAPPWSIRFVGALAAVALVAAAVGALYVASQDGPTSTTPAAAATAPLGENGDGTRTDYVGFPTDAALAPDAAQLDAAYRAWEAVHPGAEVVSKTPVVVGGRTTGYHVTYR